MKFKLTVILATFVVTISLLLCISAAQAETVKLDPNDSTRAIGITDLDVDGTPYNVDFILTEAVNLYGPYPPGYFDFNDSDSALAAVDAVSLALNKEGGVLFVGSEGGRNNGFAQNFNVAYGHAGEGPTAVANLWQSFIDSGTWMRPNEPDVSIWIGDSRTWAIFTVAGPPAPVDEVTIGGSVFFLEGSGLVLQNNGTDDETVNPGSSPENPVPFTFDTPLTPGSTYDVTVNTQPSNPDEQCIVARDSDTVPTQNVTNIVVICGPFELPPLDEIIATWSNGLWYWDLAAATWTQLSTDTTNEDLAAADFTADGIADVAAIFQVGPASNRLGAGVYYLDGASKTWTLIPNSAPPAFNITAGDVTGDGRPEIIGAWNNGIWYYNFAAATWTELTTDTTNEDIAAADFTGDGIADVAAIFQVGPASNRLGPGLYYIDGASKAWTLVPNSAPAPFSVTAGDVTGDGRPDIIATWDVGIYYWDVVASAWGTLSSTDTTDDAIAAGNFLLNGIADVAAIFQISPVSNPSGSGLYYLNGVSKALTKLPNSAPAPFSVTAGDVTGN